MKSKYKVDEEIMVDVYIRCKSQFSLRFSELELVFDNEVCWDSLIVCCVDIDEITLLFRNKNCINWEVCEITLLC